jgi:hypothetical protein
MSLNDRPLKKRADVRRFDMPTRLKTIPPAKVIGRRRNPD